MLRRNPGLARLLAAALIVAWSSDARAWGRDGHQTIGYLAASLIKGSQAEKEVGKLLHSRESLATAAEWPDCAKGRRVCNAPLTAEMTAFNHDNPKNHNYHYTDIPFGEPKYDESSIGADKNDIVHALEDAIRVLQGKTVADPAHKFSKREALFLVAHLVGDIHQPLHVGAAYVDTNNTFFTPDTVAKKNKSSTEGGNWLCWRSVKLHGAWDGDYVVRAMKDAHRTTDRTYAATLKGAAEQIDKDTGDPTGWPKKWANESLLLSKTELSSVQVLGRRRQDKSGGCGLSQLSPDPKKVAWKIDLPSTYRDEAIEIVPKQLSKAGSRLANLLQAIWP